MNTNNHHIDNAAGGQAYLYVQRDDDIESCLAKLTGSDFLDLHVWVRASDDCGNDSTLAD